MPDIAFRIFGMDCAEEVTVLRQEVGPLVGGPDRLLFDILNSKMTVRSTTASVNEITAAVARTGMSAQVWDTDVAASDRDQLWQRRGRTILTTMSGVFVILGFLVHVWLSGGFRAAIGAGETAEHHATPLVVIVIYAISVLSGVWHFLPKAWHALRRFRPDMNLLMTVAVVGAIAIGEWFEAATVAFLFSLSLALETWSVGRARRAVRALLDLAPPIVRVVAADGSEQEMAPEHVGVDSVFVVRPGERIPLDGRIVRGGSHVNQAPITGESVPVAKGPNDEVFAGTINGDGALDIRSTKLASDATLARIIQLVGEAQSRRAPSEQWVERFARYYTPAIMAVALIVLLVPPLVFAKEWYAWFYNSLVLLVIACPCALVISTPVSIVAALAAAAREGVLIKGGVFVEAPAGLKAIAFDKTGTLTVGKPVVTQVVPLSGHDERELLERAAALEARSEHPLAQAILAYARERGIQPVPAEEFQILQGKGAVGRFGGKQYWLGSHRYLEERKQETKEIHDQLEAMSGAGRTVVVIGDETHVCGLIALADRVRPESRTTIEALRRLGIEHLIMLTGDNKPTANAIANEIGLGEIRAELLPTDKVTAVESLVERYRIVAMVGDGVNDAPALGRATIGIAMGTAGSDAAIETADITLMSDDLSKLPWLIRHSRRTLSVIRLNIVFSLAVKALFMVMTVAGFASLWAAIASDTGASLLVIFNGLRLLRTKCDASLPQ